LLTSSRLESNHGFSKNSTKHVLTLFKSGRQEALSAADPFKHDVSATSSWSMYLTPLTTCFCALAILIALCIYLPYEPSSITASAWSTYSCNAGLLTSRSVGQPVQYVCVATMVSSTTGVRESSIFSTIGSSSSTTGTEWCSTARIDDSSLNGSVSSFIMVYGLPSWRSVTFSFVRLVSRVPPSRASW